MPKLPPKPPVRPTLEQRKPQKSLYSNGPVTIVNFGKLRASKRHAIALKQMIQLLGIFFILFSICALIGVGQVVTCQQKKPSMTALQCLMNEYNEVKVPTRNPPKPKSSRN